MRSGKWFGSGQSVYANYHGKVAGAQVILATDLVKLSYPFKLTSFQPAAGDSTWPLKPQPVVLTDSEWKALQADTAPQGVKFWREPQSTQTLGPVLLAVQDVSFSEHFGMQFEAEVYLSNRHSFVGIAGGMEISLTELTSRNGETHPLELQAQFPLDHGGGYWSNEKFIPNEDSPWLRGKAQLRDEKIKLTEVKSLHGTVSLNRALTTESVYFPAELGANWSNDQFSLKIVRWEKGRLVFSSTGDMTDLVTIQAINSDGTVISQPADLQWMFGKLEIALDIQNTPARIALVIGSSSERIEYPFEINLPD